MACAAASASHRQRPRRRWTVLALPLLLGPLPASAQQATGAAAVGHPFRLVAADGRIVTDRSLAGKVAVVMFGYTFCPDVCPTTLAAASAGVARLGDAARDVRILFVSVDPARDTPAVLRAYAAAFGPRVTALTGSPPALAEAARAFRARWSVTRAADGTVEVSHTGLVYLFDRDGALAKLLPPGASATRYATELRRILDQAPAARMRAGDEARAPGRPSPPAFGLSRPGAQRE